MKILKQITLILAIALIGDILSTFLKPLIPLPGSVIGIILLFSLLHYKILPLEAIEGVGEWLTNNMSILFIPGALRLAESMKLLQGQWLVVLLILTLTGILSLLGTGFFMQQFFKEESHHD